MSFSSETKQSNCLRASNSVTVDNLQLKLVISGFSSKISVCCSKDVIVGDVQSAAVECSANYCCFAFTVAARV